MTISLRALTALDPDQVKQNLNLAVAAIQEDNPLLDVSRRGSVYDILAYYHAILATQLLQNVNDYLNGRSLAVLQANSDPVLADPSLVDDAASNFGVVRKSGVASIGTVTVVVSSSTTLTLAVGTSFQAAGLTFATTIVNTAKIDPAQINGPGDRLLTALPGGTRWSFTIAVTATTVGAAGNLAGDTMLTPAVTPANFISATAAGSFTHGQDTETSTQLLTRLAAGVACKAPSNRVNFAAMLRNIDTFSRFVAMSVIGMGDAEMLRDKHTILPLALGGRVDWYIRTQAALASVLLTKTATCISVNVGAGTSIWQFALTRDDAPGFYEITNIRLAAAVTGSFAIVSDTRAVDLSGTAWVPDIANVREGDYSRYMTDVVRFTDTVTSTSGLVPGATALYTCQATCQPLINQIQDVLAAAPDTRSRVADVLVKAPVPCFVTVAVTVYVPLALTALTLTAIQNAVAAVANNTGFSGTLYASALQAAAVASLGVGSVGAMAMTGRIRTPGSGTNVNLSSNTVLTVPTDPANLISLRTAQFYLNPNDVTVTVVVVTPTS